MDLKFNGICSKEDFEFLKLKGVQYLSFDFRPLSPNFIQLYKAQEMLSFHSDFSGHIVLIFENDKDFVINEVFRAMSSVFHSERVIIDFSGLENSNILERIDVHYMLNFHKSLDFKKINIDCLSAIKISYADMALSYGEEAIGDIIKAMPTAKIAIDCSWSDDLQASFMHYSQIDIVSFTLNGQIQKSFRNLDYDLFNSFCEYNNNFFIQGKR